MHETAQRLFLALQQVRGIGEIEGPSDVARAMNVTPNVITNWQTRGVSRDGMAAAEERHNIRALYLRTGVEPMFTTGTSRSKSEVMPGVPVIGEARLGDRGYYEVQEFAKGSDGYLRIEREPGDYALRCFGDSMRPTIKPGQYVVVKTRRKPKRRDTVVCETKDGRRMIKILNDEYDDGLVELTSINEDFKPITLDRSEIDHLYYVIGPLPADFYQPTGS